MLNLFFRIRDIHYERGRLYSVKKIRNNNYRLSDLCLIPSIMPNRERDF